MASLTPVPKSGETSNYHQYDPDILTGKNKTINDIVDSTKKIIEESSNLSKISSFNKIKMFFGFKPKINLTSQEYEMSVKCLDLLMNMNKHLEPITKDGKTIESITEQDKKILFTQYDTLRKNLANKNFFLSVEQTSDYKSVNAKELNNILDGIGF